MGDDSEGRESSEGRFAVAFPSGVRRVRNATAAQVTDRFLDVVVILEAHHGELVVRMPGWEAVFLGAGEEKAVYCLRDPQDRVVAVELIDERGYLGGRLVDGRYHAELRVPGVILDADEELAGPFALRCTGLVKVREFVHGYEWSRFCFDPRRPSVLDRVLTAWLRLRLGTAMDGYRARYDDVHERNVLFELRPARAHGVLVLVRDLSGRWRWARVGLRPLDLR